MSLPRYPEYCETGLQGIGAIPQHWVLCRLRHCALLNPSKSELEKVDRGQLVSFLPMECVSDDGTLNLEQVRPLSDVESGYTYFRDGDTVVAKITPCFENGKAAVMSGLRDGIGFGTTELVVVRPLHHKVLPHFLYALFQSTRFREEGQSYMYGAGGQKRIPDNYVRNFMLALPPLDEQQQIASFIRAETAKIGVLVAEQRRLIELLKEKRQAVISHAVTKGIGPTVSMKPSGVEWIGDVPSHWKIARLKHECRYESGHTPSKSNQEYWIEGECTIPWVSLNDTKTIDASDFISDTNVKISPLGMANSSAHWIETGAVIFTRDGARVGLTAITTQPMCVSQHIIAWVCGPNVFNHFLLHVIYAMNAEIYRITAGSTIPTIGMSDVKSMVMPLPPIDEQRSIVEYVLRERARLSALIQDVENAVRLLQERRTALISAAVTGKIDVRNLDSKAVA